MEVVVSDRQTSSVSPYRYPESRDEQKPGPEQRDCETFVIPPPQMPDAMTSGTLFRGQKVDSMFCVNKIGLEVK